MFRIIRKLGEESENSMATYVKMEREMPQSQRDEREIKVGWSWTLFFFGNFFGIPWFMRGLPKYGLIGLLMGIMGTANSRGWVVDVVASVMARIVRETLNKGSFRRNGVDSFSVETVVVKMAAGVAELRRGPFLWQT
jgi:hypothetical protein